jgi:hypothetical protein
VRNASRSPLVIGTHWFKWADEPYHYSIAKNYGLVDNNNNRTRLFSPSLSLAFQTFFFFAFFNFLHLFVAYTTLTNAFKSINPTLDAARGTPGKLTANCKGISSIFAFSFCLLCKNFSVNFFFVYCFSCPYVPKWMFRRWVLQPLDRKVYLRLRAHW